MNWVTLSSIYAVMMAIGISIGGRWYVKKDIAVTPAIVHHHDAGDDGDGAEEEKGEGTTTNVVIPGAGAPGSREDEERGMIQQLIHDEKEDVWQMLVRTVINAGVSLIIEMFVVYATLFRLNDYYLAWLIILVSVLGIQCHMIHQNTELTHDGIKFIRKANTPEENPNSSWKRLKKWYKRNLDIKSDAKYAELVVIFSESIEIYTQVRELWIRPLMAVYALCFFH